MDGAYRSGGIRPAFASAARARISAASNSVTGSGLAGDAVFPVVVRWGFPGGTGALADRDEGTDLALAAAAGGEPAGPAVAGARAGGASVTRVTALAMKVTAQFSHAAPRTVHLPQSMIMSISWLLAVARVCSVRAGLGAHWLRLATRWHADSNHAKRHH
jgi:hypothetical protein